MKLLFDQNISYRILKKIVGFFPDAKQIRELGLENSSDKTIWQFAKQNNFAIVTFDADFLDLSNLYGAPPKIIWLRTGNRKTENIAKILIAKSELISQFLELDNELAYLEIL